MALNNPKSHDSSDSEDDPWEIVDDETTPLALATSSNGVTAAAVPDSYIGEVTDANVERETNQIGTNVPDSMSDSGEVGSDSFATAISSITVERHTTSDVKEGEDDVNNEEGVDSLALEEEQEVPPGALLDLTEKLLGSDESKAKVADEDVEELAAYYDETLGRWVFPLDDAAGIASPSAPPLPNTEAPDTLVVALVAESPGKKDDEKSEQMEPEKEQYEKAATDTTVAVSEDDSSEKTGEEKSENSDLVDSLSNMGFDKEQVEKTIGDLREAGATDIGYDSVIDRMSWSFAESHDTADKEKPESSDLLESLSNMGFKKEQVEKAVSVLREEGADEIDADSVIGQMEREKNDALPWDPFIEFSAQEIDQQRELFRRRTRNAAQNIGFSAKELWSNVKDESQRFSTNFKAKCDEADIPAQTARATTQVKYAASSAKDCICRANKEYRITDKLATAAVVGGATLLVLGNPRAGVGVIAVAGATLAAGEAMKHSSAQSSSTYTRDYGLGRGEGLHLD